jgi:hypothetical protein
MNYLNHRLFSKQASVPSLPWIGARFSF